MEIKTTSKGLNQLLERNGVKPTGDSKRDIELAREFMPLNYQEMQARLK